MKHSIRSWALLLLALCMVIGIVPMYALAAEAAPTVELDIDGDGVVNYVSMGASNTNGYGMRGYITEEELELLLSGQVSKDEVNVYGYQRTPEGAYPDLIRDYCVELYGEGNVVVDQLAISSMRVEELRVLLDDSYMGDDYTSWRFTGEDGWFESAEEGGLEALRAAYTEYVTTADLITVDIGWNNFGVYVCNQLMDYMNNGTYKWTTDISAIYETQAEAAAALEAKEIIRGYIVENVGEGEMADALTDIFAYSILGYMHNFDIVMEKIEALNPDAKVVVIGIQNLLYGVVVDLDGQQFPLGQIFGNFVNMANYYASACSPWQDSYQYVKAGEDEHVTIFLDQMKTYDGDAENLDQNVKDCFDYYDNDLFLQTRIDYVAAQMVEEEYGSMLSMLGYESGQEVVAAGKKGELGSLQDTFDGMYWPALYAAYDTMAVFVKEIANYEVVDANGLLDGSVDIGAVEDALADAIYAEVQENALAAADGQAYTVDLDELLPDANTKVVAAMYVRYYMGNSFFAHPNAQGHAQILDAAMGVVNDPASETDQALPAHLVESVHTIHQLLCGGKGHVEVVDGAVAATCTQAGLTEGRHCDVCGQVLVAQEEVPAAGHSYEDGTCTGCGEVALGTPSIEYCFSRQQTSVRITWSLVDGADGYELWRTTTPDDPSSWKKVKTITSGTTSSYNNNGLEEGVTYYYRVNAYVDENGQRIRSGFSDYSYMPAAVVWAGPYSNSTSRIRLRWDAVEGAHGYQIWRQNEDGTWSIIRTLGDKGNVLTNDQGDATFYSNTGLEAGKRYVYRMRAFMITEDGGKVFGAYSDEVTVAVAPESTVLTGTSPRAGRARLSWDAVEGAAGYQLWMCDPTTGQWAIAKSITDGSITSYTKNELTSGVQYQFKLRAYTEVDGRKTFGGYSETITVTVQ